MTMFDPFSQPTPRIFTISPTVSFIDELAASLLEQTKDQPETLSQYLILLPTRRACRSLREGFLRQTDGKPLLLPQMQALGDVDADELTIRGVLSSEELSIPPAISSIKRQVLLAKLIGGIGDYSRGYANDMKLAATLGQLIDQIYTENLNLSDLPMLVDRDELASHWQITTDFLKILSEAWPLILEEQGLIDAADRRNRLMVALNNHWQEQPPSHPVIAAGSTASIPATSDLLTTIAAMPKGTVILPGVDVGVSGDIWDAIEEGHPQATIKFFLEKNDISNQSIKNWSDKEFNSIKDKFISHVMLPAEKTDQWQSNTVKSNTEKYKTVLNDITQYDCDTQQDEAMVAALLLRETLETSDKTAALITPDRNLSTRVRSICARWNIDLDDSAGQSLDKTSIGTYFRLCFDAIHQDIDPVALLALLKHPLASDHSIQNYRELVRQVDKYLLRGFLPKLTWNYLISKAAEQSEELENFIIQISNEFKVFSFALENDNTDFSNILQAHIQLAENLCSNPDDILWRNEEGEVLAQFLLTLQDEAVDIGDVSSTDYIECLYHLMSAVTVRPPYGTHPRLSILGQLEARLVQADRVILAGLNEGTWPRDDGHDPWMSRPMRKKFGLPSAERSLSLAAHDFVQGICAKEVFLTRSNRVDGSPTIPSRWLERLHTFMDALNIPHAMLRDGQHLEYVRLINKSDDLIPIGRPSPTPPITARPTKMSVTKIETWIRDPYSIYAGKILRLRQLDPINKALGVSDRGIILHDILDQWVTVHKKEISDTVLQDFSSISKSTLQSYGVSDGDITAMVPRLLNIGEWFINHENQWRLGGAAFYAAEVDGKIAVTDNFTLTARVDRIDRMIDGSCAVIDYKSGGQYTAAALKTAKAPQLPLEALMIERGGFENTVGEVSYLGYWKLTGGRQAGQVTAIESMDLVQQSIEAAEEGLKNLIEEFSNPDTPYISLPRASMMPRFNDYLYLARVKEWSALDDTDAGEAT